MDRLERIFSLVFMIWSFAVFTFAMLLVLPFIILTSGIFNGKRGSQFTFFFLKVWGTIFCLLCFFRVRKKNEQAINPDKAHIYVCNHNSYLDAIAVVLAIPGAFKPLGKIEMVKIPVFGLIYRKVVVMIDRASKESRAKSVEELKRDLAGGQSILIFPEGTMNRSDQPVGEFFDGAFRLAIETQTPILPMVIIGARELFPRADPQAARPGVITCIFDEAVNVEGMAAEQLLELKTRVHRRMAALISQHS